MAITERFNEARMNRCLSVYQLIVNNWIRRNQFQCKVITDEPIKARASPTSLASTSMSALAGNSLHCPSSMRWLCSTCCG
jgi:hypothetical protein